jgi:hypothetical protein
MGCKPGKIQESEEEDVTKKKKSKNSKHRKKGRKHSHRHRHRHRRERDEIIEIDELPHDDSKNSQHEITREIHENDDTASEQSVSVDEFVDIVVADSEAFNHVFIEQRQYRQIRQRILIVRWLYHHFHEFPL